MDRLFSNFIMDNKLIDKCPYVYVFMFNESIDVKIFLKLYN